MLYIHYEEIQIPVAPAAGPFNPMAYIQYKTLVKLVASSSDTTMVRMVGQDWADWKTVMDSMKRFIAAGQRNYDPVNHVWTIPQTSFMFIFTGFMGENRCIEHPKIPIYGLTGVMAGGLDAFINPPAASNAKSTHWDQEFNQRKLKEEAPEDFFNNNIAAAYVMPETEIKQKLIKLMLPYVKDDIADVFSFAQFNEVDIDKTVMLRAYKLAARQMHPDNQRTGNAAKMSELNTLWNEYKQVVSK